MVCSCAEDEEGELNPLYGRVSELPPSDNATAASSGAAGSPTNTEAGEKKSDEKADWEEREYKLNYVAE